MTETERQVRATRRAPTPAAAIALTLLALLGFAATGCGAGTDAAGPSMRRLPPPANWAAMLQADRQAKDAFFLRSPESPLRPEDRPEFEGLDYWPPDPDLYLVGDVRYFREAETFEIPTTNGDLRPCARVGYVEFPLGGELRRLTVYQLRDQQPSENGLNLFLPFADATTGVETYPAGRYIDLAGPAGGPYVMDFNRAKNPFCAYGSPERYACPVTPAENRLPVPVPAGERGFRKPPEPGS